MLLKNLLLFLLFSPSQEKNPLHLERFVGLHWIIAFVELGFREFIVIRSTLGIDFNSNSVEIALFVSVWLMIVGFEIELQLWCFVGGGLS